MKKELVSQIYIQGEHGEPKKWEELPEQKKEEIAQDITEQFFSCLGYQPEGFKK